MLEQAAQVTLGTQQVQPDRRTRCSMASGSPDAIACSQQTVAVQVGLLEVGLQQTAWRGSHGPS